MLNFLKKTALMFFIALVIVLLDQATKLLVAANIPFGGSWSPWEWLSPFARIVHWKNTGVAFGLLQGANTVFIFLGLLIAAGIIYYYPMIPTADWLIRLALSLELGGAIGNLVDRIRLGYVVDFISVGNFPVFNVADSCVTVGVFILMIGIWAQEKREKKKLPVDTDAEIADG